MRTMDRLFLAEGQGAPFAAARSRVGSLMIILVSKIDFSFFRTKRNNKKKKTNLKRRHATREKDVSIFLLFLKSNLII